MIMGGRGLDAAWHNSGVGVEGGGEGGGDVGESLGNNTLSF